MSRVENYPQQRMHWRKRLRADLRLIFGQHPYELLPLYSIVAGLDTSLYGPSLSTATVVSVLESMSDVGYESVTETYYSLPHVQLSARTGSAAGSEAEEDEEEEPAAACNKTFQARLESHIKTARREKIQAITKSACGLLTEAARRGERRALLTELTDAEYSAGVIETVLQAVLKRCYQVTVFSQCEQDCSVRLLERQTALHSERISYKSRYWLWAEFQSLEEQAKIRLAQEQLQLLILSETVAPPPTAATCKEEEKREETEEEEQEQEFLLSTLLLEE